MLNTPLLPGMLKTYSRMAIRRLSFAFGLYVAANGFTYHAGGPAPALAGSLHEVPSGRRYSTCSIGLGVTSPLSGGHYTEAEIRASNPGTADRPNQLPSINSTFHAPS